MKKIIFATVMLLISSITIYAQQDNNSATVIDRLNSTFATDNVTTDNITTDNVTADNITTDNITTDNTTADNISTDNITTDNITASPALIDNLTTDNSTINNVTADNITTDNVTAENVNDNTSEPYDSSSEFDPIPEEVRSTDLYIMATGGMIIPQNSIFDNSFQGGLLAGFQITHNFAVDVSLLYQSLAPSKNGGSNFTAMDLKAVALFQPIIDLSPDLHILPNIGGGLVYTFKDGYKSSEQLGALAKVGVKVNYKMFIAGLSIEYAYKGGVTGGTSILLEIGVKLKIN